MVRNFLVVALRSLWRNKTVAIIQIAGFAIGMAAFIIAWQIVSYERSFDNFHSQSEIYRINFMLEESRDTWGSTGYALGPTLLSTFPEVQHAVRFKRQRSLEPYLLIETERGDVFEEEAAAYADDDFLKVFNFPILLGDTSHLLEGPEGVVLTSSAARKYFGTENPIRKTLTLKTGSNRSRTNTYQVQVDAIVPDPPPNSAFQFSMLIPLTRVFANYEPGLEHSWDEGSETFITVYPNTDLSTFQDKLNRHLPDHIVGDGLAARFASQWPLERLADMHFHQTVDSRHMGRTIDRSLLTNIGLVGVLILLIAGFNYINLTTARVSSRIKEIGIRKVSGAHRQHLFWQFLLESFLVNLISWFLAITAVQLLKPQITNLTGFELPTSLPLNQEMLLILITSACLSTIVSGVAPALLISKFKTVHILKGKTSQMSGNGGQLRRVLVVIQFFGSLVLISFTLGIVKQTQFVKNRDLGFGQERRFAISTKGIEDPTYAEFKAFKQSLKSLSAVEEVTASTIFPGLGEKTRHRFAIPGREDEHWTWFHASIDRDFVEALGLQLLSGESYSDRHSHPILLNEKAANQMFQSPTNAIGQILRLEGQDLQVVGVIGNFTHASPGEREPGFVYQFENRGKKTTAYFHHYYVLFKDGNIEEGLATVKQKWYEFFPNTPFESESQEAAFDSVLSRERRLIKTAALFSFLAVFIAVIGMKGLIIFVVFQRKKEIGIRKILGASWQSILTLLSSDFTKWITMAFLLSVPLAWYLIRQFLSDYYFAISITPELFLVPGLGMLLLAILVTGLQSLRAARENPIDSIRYE